MEDHKTVGYAYPTSPIADNMKARDGGWFAAIRHGVTYSRICGPFDGMDEAVRVASATFPELEWDRFSHQLHA